MAKQTFKAVQGQCNTLMTTMKGGVYAPIYVLMGEEPYFIDLVADYIEQNSLQDSERDFNCTILYGKDSNAEQVISQARRYPMMSQRQVVIVREAQSLQRIEELVNYVVSPLDSTVLVLCYKGKSMDKRSALYKKLNTASESGKVVIVESISPRDYEVGEWIAQYVRTKGYDIEHKAVAMLADYIGVDLTKIANELGKLFTRIAGGGSTLITAGMIEDNIGISKDFNNFELTKAISNRDIRQALYIVDHFAANPKDNPMVFTISVLFNHFQRIVTLNIHKWEQRRRNMPIASESEIARMLGLSHSFFVKEYMVASDNYPNTKAFPILGIIRQWEMKSKGMGAGTASQGELLKELILRIALV